MVGTEWKLYPLTQASFTSDDAMMLLSAASLGVPVSQPVPQCTSRVPPSYGFTPQNHVKLDELQVQTGMTAPD